MKKAHLFLLTLILFCINRTIAQTAYITNSGDGTISVIDVANNTVTETILVGQVPTGVSVSADGTKVYTTNRNDNTINVINTATNAITHILSVGDLPIGIYSSLNGSKLYVSNNGTTTIHAINTPANIVSSIINVSIINPRGVTMSPDGNIAYVVGGYNFLWIINTSTDTVSATRTVGTSPQGICISPDGNKLYVANSGDQTVSVVSTATNTVTATIPVGNTAHGICITPDGSKVYVSNVYDNTISVIDTATNTVSGTVPVGNHPIGLSVTPDGSKLYIVNALGNTVGVLDVATNTIVATIPVGNQPVAFGNFISTYTKPITPVSPDYCCIPKGISPNNDGMNDFFDLSLLGVRKLEIFNRYGIKVYQKSNYKAEWNGQSDNGNELPDGVYYYLIEFNSASPSKTGWVYLSKEY
jgi:gliding motility-associated-like protein